MNGGKSFPPVSFISLWLAVAFCTTLLYLPVMHGGPISDDFALFAGKFSVHNATEAKWVWQTGNRFDPDRAVPEDNELQTYRPLPILWLLTLKAWVGETTWPYHLANLLLHLLNTLLLGLIAGHYIRHWLWRGGVMALFALHPFITDAVAWINGLADPMMFLGLAGTWLLIIRPQTSKLTFVRLSGITLLFLAALLCKESAIFFLALLLLLPWQQRQPTTRRLVLVAALSIAVLIYFCWRPTTHLPTTHFQQSATITPFFAGWSLLTLWNWFDTHAYLNFTHTPTEFWLGTLVMLALGGSILLVWLWRSKKNAPSPITFFALQLLVAIAPLSVIAKFGAVSPRMYYSAIALQALWLGLCAEQITQRLPRLRPLLIGVWIFCLLGSGTATLWRVEAYTSHVAWAEAETRAIATDPQALLAMARRLLAQKEAPTAIVYLLHATQLVPNDQAIITELIRAYEMVQKPEAANEWRQRLLPLKPSQ